MEKKDNSLHSFWESNFQEKQKMWGLTPASSAIMAASLFLENRFQHILIPGLGYGRNAKPFLNNGMEVTGIEISETAISLAKAQFGDRLQNIYHGSVGEMPFSDDHYDGIFCYSLIHLFDKPSRLKLIEDCFNKLKPGGIMIFITVSKQFPSFGQGKLLEHNRYETLPGVCLYFYDSSSIQQDFGSYGLISYEPIAENKQTSKNQLQIPPGYWSIICRK
jgi:SAM-dependent methyltransferase